MTATTQVTIRAFRWIGAFVGIAGLVLISIFSHWAVALGVFLVIWANNLNTAASILGKTDELLDTLTKAMDTRYVQK